MMVLSASDIDIKNNVSIVVGTKVTVFQKIAFENDILHVEDDFTVEDTKKALVDSSSKSNKADEGRTEREDWIKCISTTKDETEMNMVKLTGKDRLRASFNCEKSMVEKVNLEPKF